MPVRVTEAGGVKQVVVTQNPIEVVKIIGGIKGDRGKDAYQVWLDNGNSGTVTDFLNSLGRDVYQVWLSNGNSGTEADFLASLGGVDGKSAYQSWLDYGNSGTEAEFVNSLTGTDGKSAYQEWLDASNTGSVNDFLASLEGVDGKSAYQQWIDSGQSGTEADFLNSLVGLSAYQIWLSQSYSGTETDFLNWLKGVDGKSAYQQWIELGNSGVESVFIDSLKGADGKSAYDQWIDLGNSGTLQDFMDSLKGADGTGAGTVTKVNGHDPNGSGYVVIPDATTTDSGVMSAADKLKLDSIADGANEYTHPPTHSPGIITQDANNRFVTDAQIASWNAKPNQDTTYTYLSEFVNDVGFITSAASYSVGDGGLTEKNFTTALFTKLNGIEDSANNYTHPPNHPASIITQDATNRFVTDAQIAAWDAKPNQDTTYTNLSEFVNDVGFITSAPSYSVGDGGLTEKNFTTALFNKLNGVEANANNYTHPPTHSPSDIAQDASNRFVTDAQIAAWDAKASTKADVGLGNVDNTSDASKPISTATQTALDAKADTSALSGKVDGLGGVIAVEKVTDFPTTPTAGHLYIKTSA